MAWFARSSGSRSTASASNWRSLVLLPLMAAGWFIPHTLHADCASICWLDAQNQPIDGARAALQVSRFVTNGPTLPGASYAGTSLAPTDVRLQVADASTEASFAVLESRTLNGTLRASLRVPLTRPNATVPWRSPFVRLVADETDAHARGVEARTLRVGLRDFVIARHRSGAQSLEQTLRVGLPGQLDAPNAARLARIHVHVLRLAAQAAPVIGRDALHALALMRRQLEAANEIWLQCNLSFGIPAEAAIELNDPPPPTLLAIADGDGLPARGGGDVRFRIGAQSIGPIKTQPMATPLATAQTIAQALRAHGFFAHVSDNLATRPGAGRSADILVTRADGGFVELEPEPTLPLSSDARQSLRIGRVDLSDGLQEFDNMTAQVGSLEERTLLKALSDDDPGSIDLFVVNQFTGATRQGEAFIAEPGAAIANVVVIDRNGLRHLPLAWTLAHELGHVLMNDPLHPDNIGPDRPWLLMDADSGRGTVDGPKRLRAEDCQRTRDAARDAQAPLLAPFDSSAHAE
jgi:hypothetical protein